MKRSSLVAAIIATIWCLAADSARAQAPNLINYQGRLTAAGGAAASGSFAMNFSIYATAPGVTALWSEVQTVTVTNGVFNVLLGSVTPLPGTLFTSSGDRYLGIKVGADPEMTPRFRLTSVAFALHATEADGIKDGAIVDADVSASAAIAGVKINPDFGSQNIFTTGKVGIGATPDPNPNIVLDVNIPTGSFARFGRALSNSEVQFTNGRLRSELSKFQILGQNLFGTGQQITFGQTANDVDMVIDVTGSVGIGTTAPIADGRLTVHAEKTGLSGTEDVAYFGNTTTSSYVKTAFVGSTGGIGAHTHGQDFHLFVDGLFSRGIRIQSTTGNVGIGTTNPAGILDVAIPDRGFVRLGQNAIISEVQFTNGRIHSEEAKFQILGQELAGDGVPITFGQSANDFDVTIATNGNVGIGTTSPTAKLDIGGGVGNGIRFPDGTLQTTAFTGGGLSLPFSGTNTSTSTAFEILNTGTGRTANFETTNSSNQFAVIRARTNSVNNTASFFGSNSGNGAAGSFDIDNSNSTNFALQAHTNGTGGALLAENNGPSGNIAVFQSNGANQARIDKTGKGFFNGGTQTGGADVAEAFEVENEINNYTPGDVLIISTGNDRRVEKCRAPYSSLVIGVYATKPGVLLSERDIEADLSDTIPVGVVGVIPTKVCGENGPIRRGDLLVTSSTPGHAMKGTDRERMFGATLGKALENFDGAGTGIIRVLVNAK